MAKIGNLEVGTIKMKSGSITQWFYPVSGSITVNNPSNNPTFIWCRGSGDDDLTRSSNSGIIGTVTNGANVMMVDESPDPIDGYYFPSGVRTIIAAKVRQA